MAKLVLQLAFVVSALGFVYPKCSESFHQPPIPFINLVMCVPAVLMGSWYWWKGRSFASSWPVIACVILVWLGLAYQGNSESDRGLLIAALLTVVLPMGALIVEKRAWLMCAKTYVIANGVAMAMALWYETKGDLANSLLVVYRFGFLWAEDGVTQLANPNQVGGQLAFAAVTSFIIYLKEISSQEQRSGGRWGANRYLGLAAFLSLGCLLTASRGAAASWLVGMGILTVWGTRSQSPARQKGLAFLMSGGVLLLTFGVVAAGLSPWENLQKRIGQDSALSVGNRMRIWQDAYIAWTSDPDFILRGAGTGMADEVLGGITVDAEEDDYGVLRKNCHNSYVELILSFGVLGIVCGTALAVSMFHKALLLDHGERNVGRLAILFTALVFALTAVSYRHSCWLATGSLILAMVSGTPQRRRAPAAGASHSESSTDLPRPYSSRPGRGGPKGGRYRRAFDSASRTPHDEGSN
jgi:O-antigen ligase/polysaccharide polymerase Wzy-like membrane protein